MNNKSPIVLIVEDEPIIAKDIQKRLLSLGYKAPSVSDSGVTAIKEVEKLNPDIILMDIMINGNIDGIETAELIKKMYNKPVIYVTAHASKEILRRAKLTEPYGYINKPIIDRQIHTAIEMALYKHKMESKKDLLIDELRKNFPSAKLLSELIPICSNCKKIRNDTGSWEQVEKFLQENLDIKFTHGICPDCIKALYPNAYQAMVNEGFYDEKHTK